MAEGQARLHSLSCSLTWPHRTLLLIHFLPMQLVSILSKSKEEALNMGFSKPQGRGESSWEEQSQATVKEARGMLENRACCDCSAQGPEAPVLPPCWRGRVLPCPHGIQLLKTRRHVGSCLSPLSS